MIRVVVTGSECTGKTTLARALAEHYDTVWLPELVRQFVLEKGAPPEYDDVDTIARRQLERREEAAARAATLLIQDTDLLSTVVYSDHYFGRCPEWVRAEAASGAADLYLLADIDVPWVADGVQRDRGDRRHEMQALFREALLRHDVAFHEIRGAIGARTARAIAIIDEVLAR